MAGESSTPIIHNRCHVQLVIYGNASRDVASGGSGCSQRGSSTGQVEELHVVLCIGGTPRSIQTSQRPDRVSQHRNQRGRTKRRGSTESKGLQRGSATGTPVNRGDREVWIVRLGEK